MDITDVYRTFNTNTKEHASFSAPHKMFSKIDHILRYKATPKRFKKTKILFILSGHHRLKLDSNNNNNLT